MNKVQKILFQLGLWRWEIGAGISIIILIVLIRLAAFPVVRHQWETGKDIAADIAFLKTKDELPAKSSAIAKRADMVDSLLQVSKTRARFSEPVVLEKLYTLSDSTGCLVSKVQISGPISVGSGIEIPVLLHGSGTYPAIGMFIDGIENSEYASRVRQLILKHAGNDNGSMFLDFVIMESDR